MLLTNKLNLPDALVNAVKGFDRNYQKGRVNTALSVTQLINSPYQTKLMKEHWDEIEEDVSDRIWSLLGSAVHSILEHSAGADALVEERLFMEVLGIKVSGQADHYKDEILSDYKVTKTYAVIYGKKEWETQLNILAYLYRKAGFPIKKAQIVAILKDWNKGKAAAGGNYPQANVAIVDVALWTDEQCIAYITERVKLHTNPNPDPCSPEDRWHKDDVYAVVKDGNKMAMKGGLFATEEAAKAFVAEQIAKKVHAHIEKRPGEDTRCGEYCAVGKAGLCPYRKELLGDQVLSEPTE